MSAAPNTSTPTGKVWEQIEQEKKRDRFLRRVCIGAWVATIAVMVLATLLTTVPLLSMFSGEQKLSEVPFAILAGALMPVVSMLWPLVLLIAALSTVGVFLRFRSASLAEIQLRLAALEEMLIRNGPRS